MAHTSKTEVRQSKSIGFEPSSPPADSATVVAAPGRSSALVDAAAGPAAAMVAAWLAAVLLTIHLSPSYALLIGLGFTGAFVSGLVGDRPRPLRAAGHHARSLQQDPRETPGH